ncbi:hypothetical protein [Calothrix sp. PCC 6303]|nr:hypothetical protein [Calothrix sp. PCC 6303]
MYASWILCNTSWELLCVACATKVVRALVSVGLGMRSLARFS